MKSIAVFCGSRKGALNSYIESAKRLGKELAKREIALVYGGASVGLMGAVADAALEEGGHVIGVIPEFLETKEVMHKKLSKLIIVKSMHERKAKMAELADGFIALPGGPGTMEEFFEIFTWAQLGLHEKPCGILNVNHYYDPLIALFDQMTKDQFLREEQREIALVAKEPESLLDELMTYEFPSVKRYMTKGEQT